MTKKVNMDFFGALALISMLFTLCTSRPHPGAFFSVSHGSAHGIEYKLDSAKLKAQTALAEYENKFEEAYLEALREAKASRRVIIRATDRPYLFNNDTLKIQQR